MIEAVISFIVFVAVAYIVYLLIKWVLSLVSVLPPVVHTIVDVVFGVIVVVALLRFLITLI